MAEELQNDQPVSTPAAAAETVVQSPDNQQGIAPAVTSDPGKWLHDNQSASAPAAADGDSVQLPEDLRAEVATAAAKDWPISSKPQELRELANVTEKAIQFYQRDYAKITNARHRHLSFHVAQRKLLEDEQHGRGAAFRLRCIELKAGPGTEANKNWLLGILNRALQGDLLSQPL